MNRFYVYHATEQNKGYVRMNMFHIYHSKEQNKGYAAIYSLDFAFMSAVSGSG